VSDFVFDSAPERGRLRSLRDLLALAFDVHFATDAALFVAGLTLHRVLLQTHVRVQLHRVVSYLRVGFDLRGR
jgi:hypothetical protein